MPFSEKHGSVLYEVLSKDERKRAGQFGSQEARHRFVFGRGVVRHVLAEHLGMDAADIPLACGKFGKPHVVPEKFGTVTRMVPDFSVAHSKDCLLIAVTEGRKVGIDVEHMRSGVNDTQLAQRFFSPAEIEQLHRLTGTERKRAFFHVWTRKEAFVKALGRGLAFGLSRFSVTVAPQEAPCLLEIDGSAEAAAAWALVDLQIGPDYAACLCVEGKKAIVHVRSFALS